MVIAPSVKDIPKNIMVKGEAVKYVGPVHRNQIQVTLQDGTLHILFCEVSEDGSVTIHGADLPQS